MHINSATGIRVPTKGGSPSVDGNDILAMMTNRNWDVNSHNNTVCRRRPRNWSLGSNFDLLDGSTVSENNFLRRNTSNGSFDIAASIFSSLQELPPNRNCSSTSSLNSLGIQVGTTPMADYDYGTLLGSSGLGIGMGGTGKERSRPVSAVDFNLNSFYEPELRAGEDAAVRVTGQGNRSLAMTMQTSDAASALRRIEMEELLLQQPYHDLEEQHRRQMKEILRMQQQQNQILSNESRKTMMNTQGRYTPVQSLSPHQPDHQRLHLSQQLHMQEQLRYQNQSQKQIVPPSRWPSSQSSRLTDFSIEELFQEVSRRSGETLSFPNFSADWIGGTERVQARETMDSLHFLPSKTGHRNEVNDHKVMNTALHGDTSEVVRCRQRKSSSEVICHPVETFPPSSERGMVRRLHDSIAEERTDNTLSKSVDEATNSSVVSGSTSNVDIEDNTPKLKWLRNTSFDTLLSVFEDELAELDREESGKRNPNEAASLSGSVGTITLDDLVQATGFEGGPSSIPSSLSSTSITAQAYLAELKGLVLPPPPLTQPTTAMRYVHHQPHQEPTVPPPSTIDEDPTHHNPLLNRIDPNVGLQQFLDKYGEAAQNSRTDLLNAISETEKSLVTIHDWDRRQGLRKCHSRTVVKTRRSRAKVKAFLLGVDPPKELVKKTKRKKESG